MLYSKKRCDFFYVFLRREDEGRGGDEGVCSGRRDAVAGEEARRGRDRVAAGAADGW